MKSSLLNSRDLERPAVSHYICGFQTATCRCIHMNNFEKRFNLVVENRVSQMCKVTTCTHGLVTGT